jgi:hypothetical protein
MPVSSSACTWKYQPKADLAKAACEARVAQAHRDAMAKWHEADCRFGITAAEARAEKLAEA